MSYIARFTDDLGNKHVRKYFASHVTHAQRKAQGIAKSNKWKLESVGVA